MENYSLQLQQILAFFVSEQNKYKIELQSLPDGKLQVIQEKKRVQYIWKTAGRRLGINKKPELVRQLARKEFIIKLLAEIESNIEVLQRAITEFRTVSPNDIISKMTNSYRRLQHEMFFPIQNQHPQHPQSPTSATLSTQLSDPLFTTEEDDLAARLASHEEWASMPYERNSYPMGPYAQFTSRGLKVRSAREQYIAERLYYHEVPFRYDQILHINGYTLSPDFSFEQADKTEFHMEYWGMMDDEEYVGRFFRKRRIYESCGLYEWDNMIYVFSKDKQVNTQQIEDVIKHLIIPRL